MVIIIPRVMMNGFIFIFAMRSPFTSPTAKAATRESAMAMTEGTPATSARPQTTPVKARVEPTERSSPPETRRIDMPTTMGPSTESPRRIASRFGQVRNTGDAAVMMAPPTTSTRMRMVSRKANTARMRSRSALPPDFQRVTHGFRAPPSGLTAAPLRRKESAPPRNPRAPPHRRSSRGASPGSGRTGG